MGIVAFSAAMSHAPGITAFPDAPPSEQRERFFSAVNTARDALTAAKPDALIVIAPDHFTNFFIDNMPAFCVGLNESYVGPAEDWLGICRQDVPGAPDLAKEILNCAFESGIEPAFSETLRLEHSAMVPLSLLTPNMNVPIVWVMLNCQVPPLPGFRRCIALGQAIRKVIERRSGRVAVLATGGLSHSPGAAEMDHIDEPFDREFLSLVERHDVEAILALPSERIDEAGFGTWEVRQWLTLMGVVPERRGRVLSYEAIKEWDTGCAVVLFN
jgi:aromatic ring-opening dioxygenase catalytic subunit (LigB family)